MRRQTEFLSQRVSRWTEAGQFPNVPQIAVQYKKVK